MCGKQSINNNGKKQNEKKEGDGLRSIKTYSDTFIYHFIYDVHILLFLPKKNIARK